MSLFDSYRASKPRLREDEPVHRVADVVRLARASVEALGELWVEGEVAECTRSPAGHVYFTLVERGQEATLRCTLFRSAAARNRTRPESGQRVRVRGRPTIYEAQGRFQLTVSIVTEAGAGDRAAELARLKEKLEAEGLFAIERKRPLPRLPRVVGLVTSTNGAAMHDVLRVAEGRCPVRIVVADCRVQGAEAPDSIVAALAAIQQLEGLEVVIVGRGGGAQEDLAAFQDERVVRAIAGCDVPIVSAVGHETDVTLADLAADVRAATPSNAAELVVPDRRLLEREVESARRALERAMSGVLAELRQQVARNERAVLANEPDLSRARRRVLELAARLEGQMRRRLARANDRRRETERALYELDPRVSVARSRARFAALSHRLEAAMRARLARERRARDAVQAELRASGRNLGARERMALGDLVARLHSLSPLAVLARGYAIALDGQGATVHRASAVELGDSLRVLLHEGELSVTVSARKIRGPVDV